MKKLLLICFGIITFLFFRNLVEETKDMPLTYLQESKMNQSNNIEGMLTENRIFENINIDSMTDIESEDILGDKYNFYYDLLETSIEKRLYIEFYKSVKKFDTSFYITTNVNQEEDIGSVFLHVLYDNPSFFYVDYDSISIEKIVGGKVAYKVKWKYLYSQEEVKTLLACYENMINIYFNRNYSDDYEVAKDVFRFVSDIVKYGGKTEDGQNIVSAFTERQAVCGGYTMASKYIFDHLGIPCIYVSGMAIQDTNGNMGISPQEAEGHAWNKIMLNEKWYNFDCTWGDVEMGNFDYYNYKYLMISDDILCKTHEPVLEYAEMYPKCIDKLDFYIMNNLYLTLHEDSNVFLNKFVNVLNFYKSNVIQFKVENLQQFEEFLKNGYLYQYFSYIENFNYEKYSYMIDNDSNIVTIIFSN